MTNGSFLCLLSKFGIHHNIFCRLIAERETVSHMQRELEEHRLQLVEASRSQALFVRDLQQQCAHLHLELDAARQELNSVTELKSQKSSQTRHHHSVEKVDKGLQTALPLPMEDLATAVPERLPAQDKALVRNTAETYFYRITVMWHYNRFERMKEFELLY
jgi:TolA-binding protein